MQIQLETQTLIEKIDTLLTFSVALRAAGRADQPPPRNSEKNVVFQSEKLIFWPKFSIFRACSAYWHRRWIIRYFHTNSVIFLQKVYHFSKKIENFSHAPSARLLLVLAPSRLGPPKIFSGYAPVRNIIYDQWSNGNKVGRTKLILMTYDKTFQSKILFLQVLF